MQKAFDDKRSQGNDFSFAVFWWLQVSRALNFKWITKLSRCNKCRLCRPRPRWWIARRSEIGVGGRFLSPVYHRRLGWRVFFLPPSKGELQQWGPRRMAPMPGGEGERQRIRDRDVDSPEGQLWAEEMTCPKNWKPTEHFQPAYKKRVSIEVTRELNHNFAKSIF